MRHSHLEKIDEEGNSALDDSANPFSNNRTIYLNQQTEELSRDALKSQTSIENHLTGSNIFRSTTTPAMNIESKLRATQRLSKTRGSRIEIVNSQKEMKSLKSRISFYKGKPRTEEDIIKLDCPLYRCQTNTIIRSNIKKEFLFEESKGNYDNPKDISGNKSVNKTEENVSEPKGKLTTAIVNVRLANIMELRTFESLFMTILQIINCIIKYTIVQFPFCIKWLGLVYGPIIISIIGAMSIYSIYMLIKVQQITGEKSYSAFAYKWMGMKGKLFILILNSLSSFGSCLSYIIIFLKLIPNLVSIETGKTFLANETLLSFILSIWLVIYCYQKDVSGIKAAAYWGVLGIVSFLFLDILNMLIWSWNEHFPESREMNFTSINFAEYDVYTAIATIILSYNYHMYTFSIYECIENPNSRKMIVTSSIGVFTSTLIYLIVGTIGYILYGNIISDSILDTMGYSNISMLMSISFVVNVIMSFPITFNCLKHYVIFIIELILTLINDKLCKKTENTQSLLTSIENLKIEHKGKKADDEQIKDDSESDDDLEEDDDNNKSHAHPKMVRLPEYFEYLIVFGLFALIFYTANKSPEIKILFGYLGATTANLSTFILPALFYLRFSQKKFFSWTNLLALLFIIVGLLGFVVCLASNILSSLRGTSH